MPDLTKLTEQIEKQNSIFEDYKKEVSDLSDKQKNLEGGQGEIKEKLARMDEAFDEIDKLKEDFQKEAAKANAAAAVNDVVKNSKHAQTFKDFLRKGDSPEIKAALKDFEKEIFNSVDVTTGANGEYAVPDELSRIVYSLAGELNAMRSICRVIQVSSPNHEELVNTKGATAEWVGEKDTRSETDTPTLALLSPFWGELSALPYATQNSLDDIFFDVGNWLVENVIEAFIDAEEAAFISGNGTKKPKGFLAYDIEATADASRDFGNLENVVSGKADGFLTPTASASPADCLIDLIGKLKEKHLPGATFLMNRATKAAVRKFKAYSTGDFIWQPGIKAGQPDELLGYPIATSGSMPAVAADAYPLAFGNFKRGYTIVDRIGIRVLRDPYSNKPYVGFYTTKRVGGFVKDSQAIKILKISA
jgi:HK97 family phage major capsid protein